ncbi:MAG: cysteine dioxygenase family protein [Acidimicrobiia bacterium]|nr:cysteine dioxygenase family protein [Acidimicrobiia bacterium]
MGQVEILEIDQIALIAGGLAASDLWTAHARVDHVRRHHVRLLRTDLYEAWLLGWAPGQHVGMHDHGEAAGAFVVVRGELREVLPESRRSTVDLGAGSTGVVRRGQLHDVGNASDTPALSIHVYSPPLSTMTFYDASGRAPLRTEAVS